MSADRAVLSTVSTQIDDLVIRVVEIAEEHRGSDTDDVAIRLFEVERALQQAQRGLQSAVRFL